MEYSDIYSTIKRYFDYSYNYFSSVCKPIASHLKLFDYVGVFLVNGKFCGNTILDAYYCPRFSFEDMENAFGTLLHKISTITGKYVNEFNARHVYKTNPLVSFETKDYGGFKKLPSCLPLNNF